MYRVRQAFEAQSLFRKSVLNYRGGQLRSTLMRAPAPTYK